MVKFSLIGAWHRAWLIARPGAICNFCKRGYSYFSRHMEAGWSNVICKFQRVLATMLIQCVYLVVRSYLALHRN